MKKILLILLLIGAIVLTACALTGDYTTNGYFYLPGYGEYGTDAYDEYNTYMQVADTQIEANKTASGDENIEDTVGAMTTGNTKTFITVTYQDATADIDFVVPVKDEDNMASDSATFLCTQQSIKAYADTLHALQYLKTEMNDFSKLQGIISDKTLVNEEDVFTIDANWVNTANPWADNEVANNITIDLATLATTFTVTDNENEALNCLLVFVDGATGSQGAESDGDLHYNPSTGTLTSTIFAGQVTVNTKIDLNEFYLLIDDDLGSDHDYSGLVDSANVGESVVFGDLLYYDWTAVEWKKAKANVVGTTPAMRIALESKTDGQACLMLVQGYIRDDSAFDFGASRIYLNDDTAGTCDDTAPAESGDQIQIVGIGITADKMYFCPSIDVGEI